MYKIDPRHHEIIVTFLDELKTDEYPEIEYEGIETNKALLACPNCKKGKLFLKHPKRCLCLNQSRPISFKNVSSTDCPAHLGTCIKIVLCGKDIILEILCFND